MEYPSPRLRMLVVLFIVISMAGLAFSSAVQVATFFSSNLDGIWRFFCLTVGIFVVALPATAIYRYTGEAYEPAALPRWSRVPLYVAFGYFIYNMI